MESSDTFEIGAEIGAISKSRPYNQTSKGPDAVTAALGSPSPPISSERAPLLRSSRRESSHSRDLSAAPKSAWTGDEDFKGLPWWRTPSIWWLLVPFSLFAVSFGGTIVIKINIILGLICKDYLDRSVLEPSLPVLVGSDNPQCQIPEVQSLVSKFTLCGTLISGILSTVISPKLGALSDRYGRTYLMAASTFCLMINEVIFVIVARCSGMISFNYILLGFFFDGLGGSFIAVMAISYAYASDCTPPQKRNVTFGYYQGCFFGGMALGPLFGGYVVKATGNILSIFYVALIVHALFFLDLLFVMPESLTKKRQLAARNAHRKDPASDEDVHNSTTWLKSVVSVLHTSNILAPLSILWPTEAGTTFALRRNIALIAAVDTVMFGIAMGAMTVILIYSEFMFGWGNLETSIYLSTVSTSRTAVLFALLPLVNHGFRTLGTRTTRSSGSDSLDLALIRIALIFDLLGYIGFATVRTGALFTASGVLASLGSMGSPTLQSALTKHVPPERVGQVLGAMGLLHAAARVVAPLIYQLIYAETVGKFSQTVFVSLAATWALALVLAMFIRPHVHWDDGLLEENAEDDANE